MGFALAEACAARGAEVELIAGPVAMQTHHPHIKRTDVTSAQQMYEAATSIFPHCDTGILCAAVADFTVAETAKHKIKREGSGGLHLDLIPTHDIARALGAIKRNDQKLVGFALETDHELEHATDKLKRKTLISSCSTHFVPLEPVCLRHQQGHTTVCRWHPKGLSTQEQSRSGR